MRRILWLGGDLNGRTTCVVSGGFPGSYPFNNDNNNDTLNAGLGTTWAPNGEPIFIHSVQFGVARNRDRGIRTPSTRYIAESTFFAIKLGMEMESVVSSEIWYFHDHSRSVLFPLPPVCCNNCVFKSLPRKIGLFPVGLFIYTGYLYPFPLAIPRLLLCNRKGLSGVCG